MEKPKSGSNRTVQIAGAAVFGALAWLLAVPQFLRIPFFPLTYLTFDFAEIPVMFSFLVFGPMAGIISSLVLWATLSFVGTTGTFGATMKFVAVASSALGMWLGISLFSKILGKMGLRAALSSGLVFATISRVILMTIANYVALVVIFPDFLGFAVSLAEKTGLVASSSPFSGVVAVLLITGIYNVIHIFISLLPSFFLSTLPSAGVTARGIGEPWIYRISRR
ncbi:MAG: hypothetical protein HYU39_06260 [Thaumarchaeota archaeon]|nr:hypothetical protein [Nitrososphaerota archaeon]